MYKVLGTIKYPACQGRRDSRADLLFSVYVGGEGFHEAINEGLALVRQVVGSHVVVRDVGADAYVLDVRRGGVIGGQHVGLADEKRARDADTSLHIESDRG